MNKGIEITTGEWTIFLNSGHSLCGNDIVGKLFLGDISVPPDLYKELGIHIGSIFDSDIIVDLQHLNGNKSFSDGLFITKKGQIEDAIGKSSRQNCLILE